MTNLSLKLLLLSVVSHSTFYTSAQPYDGCDIDSYYANLPSDTTTWTRQDLSELLTSTQRNILPVQQDNGDDIYTALIDLYPGDSNDTVEQAFRAISFPTLPYANAQTWTRANLWPLERIASALLDVGADTDVHANVCADTTVLSSKEDLFFGQCGLVQVPEDCQPLAETNLTYSDNKIWQSPEVNRGAQARQNKNKTTRYFSQEVSGGNFSLELGD